MTGFLGEIGQKLADRWAALLAVPGLLYLAAVTAAVLLGQHHALSYPEARRQISDWATSPALKSAGVVVLLVAAVLAGSVLAGLAAVTGGQLAELLWTLPGRHPPARWLAAWRRNRSRRAKAAADDPKASPAQVRKAMDRADRICVIAADCPTWIGDRLRACHVRIERTYGLDLTVAWPRLWLIVPDGVRTELGTARDAFSSAGRLAAWGLLYLVLGIWWWPAIPIALITFATARVKGRRAAANLADLLEAAVDLHGKDLATALGDSPAGPLTPATGGKLTILMRKSRWDPASPLADD